MQNSNVQIYLDYVLIKNYSPVSNIRGVGRVMVSWVVEGIQKFVRTPTQIIVTLSIYTLK